MSKFKNLNVNFYYTVPYIQSWACKKHIAVRLKIISKRKFRNQNFFTLKRKRKFRNQNS